MGKGVIRSITQSDRLPYDIPSDIPYVNSTMPNRPCVKEVSKLKLQNP
jgi:hypothetical protein